MLFKAVTKPKCLGFDPFYLSRPPQIDLIYDIMSLSLLNLCGIQLVNG